MMPVIAYLCVWAWFVGRGWEELLRDYRTGRCSLLQTIAFNLVLGAWGVFFLYLCTKSIVGFAAGVPAFFRHARHAQMQFTWRHWGCRRAPEDTLRAMHWIYACQVGPLNVIRRQPKDPSE